MKRRVVEAALLKPKRIRPGLLLQRGRAQYLPIKDAIRTVLKDALGYMSVKCQIKYEGRSEQAILISIYRGFVKQVCTQFSQVM